jgi:hypothetical protein
VDAARRVPAASASAASNEAEGFKRVISAIPGSFEVNESKVILELLKHDGSLHVDSLIEGSGLRPQNVLRLLLELELRGLVAQHPGKLFSLA